MPELNSRQWREFLLQHPNAHILQTQEWGTLKDAFGWDVTWVVSEETGAQIMFRQLPMGFSFGYIPKGPVGNNWHTIWPEIDNICRKRRAVFIKIEPDIWQGAEDNSSVNPTQTMRFSPHGIQPQRTLIVDLRGSDDQVLGRMKQKTRYNIGLASRKGVTVSPSNDIRSFYTLMQITSERETFGIHQFDYYQKIYELFYPRGLVELLFAKYQGDILGALMVFTHGNRAWYFYGASSNEHRNRMPSYILQWETMKWARSQGCLEYDLWGVPDVDIESLERNFLSRSDGLWGVYRFKRGFGGELKRAVGPWDRVYHPIMYALYRWWVGRRSPGFLSY
jgi:peptidoglycan pentaglycine glycine transferase (the first glycine)